MQPSSDKREARVDWRENALAVNRWVRALILRLARMRAPGVGPKHLALRRRWRDGGAG